MTTNAPAPARARARSSTAGRHHHSTTVTQELKAMLMYEVLARTRMREDQLRAGQARLATQLAAVRRWQRLARYADHRVHRAITRL